MEALRTALLSTFAVTGLFSSQPTWACSVCGCGDPLLSANDPAAVSGRLRVGIDTEYLTVKSGNEANPAATDKLDQYTLRLTGVTSPRPGLSLMAQIPLTRKNLATNGITGSDLSGIGDVELGARYTLLDFPDFSARRRQSLAVAAGTSFPTGSRTATVNGVPVDEHGQLGTGAWGPYAGLHYRFEQERWTVFASATGRLHTTNSDHYHYGNAALWSFHGQFWTIPRLALDLGLDGRYAAADTQDGATVDNTGGTVLAASPGVYWNAGGAFWLSLRAQIPFYSNLNGNQSVGPTVVVGFLYQLL
jgi:hypothetical protein